MILGMRDVVMPDLMSHRSTNSPSRVWVFLALILLVAGGLRFYRIDAQSFWNDEGNSARLAERSVELIVEGARGDIHPPGYYLALHYWRAVLGQSEAALRGLSAVCGIALAIFAFLLGRRLVGDEVVGLWSAALVAINPFQVYYAQEARMYAMLALWALASTWAMVAWLDRVHEMRSLGRWLLSAYVLTVAAGLYTHYAFPFVLLAQNLSVGMWLWHMRGKHNTVSRLLQWGLAQLTALLLYLPWLPVALHQVASWSPPREAFQPLEALLETWRLLSFGQTIPTEVVTGGLIAAGSCVFLSFLPPVNESAQPEPDQGFPFFLRWASLASLIVIPLGLILGLNLYREAYQKFLLVASAPLSVMVARGLVSGWRIAGGVGVWGEREAVVGYRGVILLIAALLLFDTGRSLNHLYFDEAYARADYRAIAQHIEAGARPGDGIILNAPNQWEVFTYYYPHDEHVFPLARQRPLNFDLTEAELERIAADHQRIYAIFWGDAESDPTRFVESWLEAHTFKAGETWYADVRLAVYGMPAKVADTPAANLVAHFQLDGGTTGPIIHLDGYTLLDEQLEPGEILQLVLFWRTEQPISDRYKVFVHIYDEAGEILAQTDSEPGATLHPTDTWLPGERVIDRYGVLIPAQALAGTYTLGVGLYDLVDPSSRLQIVLDGERVGDRLDLARIDVVRSASLDGKE